jgi:hypothetical protein
MQLPLHIVQVGTDKVNRTEQTRDISSGGICFLSQDGIEVGGRIEYLITLSGSNPPVRIRCLGKVMRSERQSRAEVPWEIALTMERYQFVTSRDPEVFAIAS